MMTTKILWIGANERDEFARIWNALSSETSGTRIADLAQAEKQAPARLVVLAVSRPGEFSSSAVEKLQAAWPHCQFVYLLGAWCCGEKRVAVEHTRVPTLYLHQLQSENIVEQLTAAAGKGEGPGINEDTRTIDASLVVYARTASYRAALSDALVPVCDRCIELNFGDSVPTRGIDLVIWEAHPHRPKRDDELQEIKVRHPQAAVLALVTFPRQFELDELQAASIQVLAQPFQDHELLAAIQGCLLANSNEQTLRMIA